MSSVAKREAGFRYTCRSPFSVLLSCAYASENVGFKYCLSNCLLSKRSVVSWKYSSFFRVFKQVFFLEIERKKPDKKRVFDQNETVKDRIIVDEKISTTTSNVSIWETLKKEL